MSLTLLLLFGAVRGFFLDCCMFRSVDERGLVSFRPVSLLSISAAVDFDKSINVKNRRNKKRGRCKFMCMNALATYIYNMIMQNHKGFCFLCSIQNLKFSSTYQLRNENDKAKTIVLMFNLYNIPYKNIFFMHTNTNGSPLVPRTRENISSGGRQVIFTRPLHDLYIGCQIVIWWLLHNIFGFVMRVHVLMGALSKFRKRWIHSSTLLLQGRYYSTCR